MTTLIEQAKNTSFSPGDNYPRTIDNGYVSLKLRKMGRPKEKDNEIIKAKKPIFNSLRALKIRKCLGYR